MTILQKQASKCPVSTDGIHRSNARAMQNRQQAEKRRQPERAEQAAIVQPLTFAIRCVPPKVTAQQKRLAIVAGRPRFFHGAKMREQEHTWTSLLMPYVPAVPMLGAVELAVTMVYPHLKGTPKRDHHLIIPKVTKPDGGNAAKHLIDLLARLRFIGDDAAVARETVDKFHGPDACVGIQITICPMFPFVPQESPC